MEFKQPELLYALFLLLIPLAVHLFQLRQFQKEDFTNVKFLKKVIRQTRKSSRLKKWLVLTCRTLLLTFLILAFAQPYFPAKNPKTGSREKVIFLDNSYSMQAGGKDGELFTAAIRDLIKNLPEEQELNLFTHNEEFKNLTSSNLTSTLQNLEFTQKPLDFNTLKLKASQLFKDSIREKDFIFISDFQKNLGINKSLDTSYTYHFIPVFPESTENISIDSMYIKHREVNEIDFRVLLSSTGNFNSPQSVSLFSGEDLLAKTSVNFKKADTATANFKVNQVEIPNGVIKIEDASLDYDNSLFFSLNKPKPPKVVIITKNAEATFLRRILSEPEFITEIFKKDQLDFNKLNTADLIILNELESISGPLQTNLTNLHGNAVPLVVIPSTNSNLNSYNSFLNRLNAPQYSEVKTREALITELAFDHPLLQGVFQEKVENFDYPKVQTYHKVQNGNKIISFQDNSGFLVEENGVFLFAAALNEKNSNFRNSPLIVPVIYNIGLKAFKSPNLYYETGKNEKIRIPIDAQKDKVVHVISENIDFIPKQRSLGNTVVISTDLLEVPSGNYTVEYNKNPKAYLSFNAPRNESDLEYFLPENAKNIHIYQDINTYFNELKLASQSNELWKSFVIFALIFLIIEMLLLKYLK
ncbi:hypothetical protein GUB10_01125 [Salegentibacter sp. BLCTC]|uniref:BatA domain-containing protein n=1 Tax=Salegentibacter sp. BLCTC TaxID=2697368 RepID=UPI00187B645B|nr:BatA domain-containing protein [Salegentibacter sp. BLCTC]MBE7638921.1 hypothetical protein [Salegentibacter sp. BLCTC]